MLTLTFGYLEPFVAATRPGRLVLVRRFLLALARALRSEAERDGACAVAGTVFGMPASVLAAAATRGPEFLDQFLAHALTERLLAAPEGLDSRADWLIRWGPLVESLVPEGPDGASTVPDLVSLSPDMAAFFARLPELGRSSLPLLLEGQPGTGRESLARAVHNSHRGAHPFVSIDAAQLDPANARKVLFDETTGLIVRAGEGTLFIRNAEQLPQSVQHQIARCLESGSLVSDDGTAVRPSLMCRFIFAVSENALDTAGPGLGALSPDFAYRASTLFARLPPLAPRGEDLAALYRNVVRRFVLRKSQPMGTEEVALEPRMTLTPRALMALYAYPWPGNVTEFVAVVREARQRAGAGPVELSHLPERVIAALGRGGDEPEDRLRRMLVDIAPAAVAGPEQVNLARRRLRRWRDEQLDTVLDRPTLELLTRSIAGFNALREGQHDPLPLEWVLAQVRAAAAREVLLPMGANVPLFWEERAELVAELEAVAAAHPVPGAISRRLFDLGRALVLYREQALAQLTPGRSGDSKASAVTLALVTASSER
jgi:transcriptional regulator with AAA-type ATPase domain